MNRILLLLPLLTAGIISGCSDHKYQGNPDADNVQREENEAPDYQTNDKMLEDQSIRDQRLEDEHTGIKKDR